MMMVILKSTFDCCWVRLSWVGPEHAYLESIKRVKYVAVTNEDAIEAFKYLSKTEGIIPAIESAHAVAYDKTR